MMAATREAACTWAETPGTCVCARASGVPITPRDSNAMAVTSVSVAFCANWLR